MIEAIRALLVAANVFVCVYAFISSARMEYGGSRFGRIALGVYAMVVVINQVTIFASPLTFHTLLASIATAFGLGWFGIEVFLSGERKNL